MADDKVPGFVSTEKQADLSRRRSSLASIAGGFETANVLGRPVNVDKGLNPHGNSTTFASAGLDAYYKPQPHWEGLHRYDPDFTWEPSEERRLVRKLDWRICTFACFMFFALQLDRGNITQALSDVSPET